MIRAANPQAVHDVKRMFADGDHVIVHYHVRRWPDDNGFAVMDIFRIEDGLIAEHWGRDDGRADRRAQPELGILETRPTRSAERSRSLPLSGDEVASPPLSPAPSTGSGRTVKRPGFAPARPFGQFQQMRDESEYVVGTITAFLNGSRNPWDWIASHRACCGTRNWIASAGARALSDSPLDAEGRAILQDLLEQAELVRETDPAKPKPWHIEAGMAAGLLGGAVLWWVNYLPGMSVFHNLHLLFAPVALGFFVVTLRNSRKKGRRL